MKCFRTGIFLLLLANTVVSGQPIHKNTRLHIQTMPENLDSAIRSEILSQRVPVRVVDAAAAAELIMKETSGFTSTDRHKEGIRLIIEIFDFAGSKRWPGSPEARFYWIEEASHDWQSRIAQNIVKKLAQGVQRYNSTASSRDDWWPFTMKRPEKRADPTEADTGPDQATGATEESSSASLASTYRTPPAEVHVDWDKRDTTQVEVRFKAATFRGQVRNDGTRGAEPLRESFQDRSPRGQDHLSIQGHGGGVSGGKGLRGQVSVRRCSAFSSRLLPSQWMSGY